MPFGLRNAAQTFQRLMDHLLRGLPFVFVYLDNILVASPDLSTQLSHLAAVLDIFQAKGLLVNLAKCFLPNPLSPAWSTPSLLPASLPSPLMLMPFVSILFPPLSRICSVFLASLILPLFSSSCHHYTPTPHCCPRWKSPISHMVNWSLAMLAAFHHIKEVLGSATLFFHPHPTAPI